MKTGIAAKIMSAFGFFVLVSFLCPNIVLAGIGISPAAIQNSHVKPGTSFESEINVSRSDAAGTVDVELEKDMPDEMGGWVTFTPGTKFTIPAGQNSIDFKVIFTVPANAEQKKYTGYIRVKTSTVSKGGAVAVVKGARIDINIEVTDKDFIDLLVRKVVIANIYQNEKLSLIMTIENRGNIEAAPTKATIDVKTLDNKAVATLETTSIPKVAPNTTADVAGSISHSLVPGNYYANVKVYNGSTTLREELLTFEIKAGSRPSNVPETGGTTFQVIQKAIKDNLTYVIGGGVALLLILIIVFMLKSRKKTAEPLKSTEPVKPIEPIEPAETTTEPKSEPVTKQEESQPINTTEDSIPETTKLPEEAEVTEESDVPEETDVPEKTKPEPQVDIPSTPQTMKNEETTELPNATEPEMPSVVSTGVQPMPLNSFPIPADQPVVEPERPVLQPEISTTTTPEMSEPSNQETPEVEPSATAMPATPEDSQSLRNYGHNPSIPISDSDSSGDSSDSE